MPLDNGHFAASETVVSWSVSDNMLAQIYGIAILNQLCPIMSEPADQRPNSWGVSKFKVELGHQLFGNVKVTALLSISDKRDRCSLLHLRWALEEKFVFVFFFFFVFLASPQNFSPSRDPLANFNFKPTQRLKIFFILKSKFHRLYTQPIPRPERISSCFSFRSVRSPLD